MALAALLAPVGLVLGASPSSRPTGGPFVVVLGVAQDGGVPQAGTKQAPGWNDPKHRRRVACLGIVDPDSGRRWMIEATPDFREQLHRLDTVAPAAGTPGLDGIFLTHAHMGHYTGLMFLGKESMGAQDVPVYAMPRLAEFLESNGPWSQLVRLGNIRLAALKPDVSVAIGGRIRVTPFPVPHRQEFSEVVGFRIEGPRRRVLFIPDIDRWEDLDARGVRIEDAIAGVDVAYLDGTFFADGEIPGRDMSTFPHPFITRSMERFASLPERDRAKVRFIHLNHTNPALQRGSAARRKIEAGGFKVAEEGERVEL
jgi:pyrroloquinoline quinone biosynthesis protein B